MKSGEERTILNVLGLSKKFGGLLALSDVKFEVREGRIIGIIGPNGAGKTTLFNVISGFLKPMKGKVMFEGSDITGLKPHRIAKSGLVRTWQLVNLIGNRSALDNIMIAHHLQYQVGPVRTAWLTPTAREEEETIRKNALGLMNRMGLEEYKHEFTSSLPHGIQRLIGVCMALATKPKLLLLDEPTAGMSSTETAVLIQLIREIRRQGITVLLVEHNMKVIMTLCDRIVVLNFGKKLAEGTPEEISKDEEVVKAYLGLEYKMNCHAA